jgi:ABC-type glycerol-3-phosphate transport system permease component
MPAVKPAWLTLIIFSFQNLWNREGLAFIYDESLKLLPSAFRQIGAAGIGRSGVAAAAAVILLIPPLVTFLIVQSNVIETMTQSGIKS